MLLQGVASLQKLGQSGGLAAAHQHHLQRGAGGGLAGDRRHPGPLLSSSLRINCIEALISGAGRVDTSHCFHSSVDKCGMRWWSIAGATAPPLYYQHGRRQLSKADIF